MLEELGPRTGRDGRPRASFAITLLSPPLPRSRHHLTLRRTKGPSIVSTREPTRTPREVLAFLREREVKAVDLRFMDFPGLWKHFTIPAEVLDEDKFEDGIGFDGSSIRGWMPINESDMLLVPQPDTLFIDPFCKDTTLAMICNIQDPLTKEDYSKDPRNVARKAVNYMKQQGVADAAMFGPSLEFFVF